MPAGLPTLSELRSASFDHLGQAAGWWERIGRKAESAFAELTREVRTPGGVEWQGAAGIAAVERADADLLTVRGWAFGWQEAGAIARLGQDNLAAGKALALEAISAAERDGFAVGEGYSVIDTRPTSSREQQAARQAEAQAHAAYIRHRVATLVANDADLTARLKAATAGFGNLVFAESPVSQAPPGAPLPEGPVICTPFSAKNFLCEEILPGNTVFRWVSPVDFTGLWPD
ncbi:hypothetical protein [Mycobacterium sp.]|uniref:hypothetical protein n=1 Tax=Mycobacterium sp. TaxID=1785 RepID=UPI003D6AE7F8